MWLGAFASRANISEALRTHAYQLPDAQLSAVRRGSRRRVVAPQHHHCLMSIELILNAVNLNLIAFSRYLEINEEAAYGKGACC